MAKIKESDKIKGFLDLCVELQKLERGNNITGNETDLNALKKELEDKKEILNNYIQDKEIEKDTWNRAEAEARAALKAYEDAIKKRALEATSTEQVKILAIGEKDKPAALNDLVKAYEEQFKDKNGIKGYDKDHGIEKNEDDNSVTFKFKSREECNSFFQTYANNHKKEKILIVDMSGGELCGYGLVSGGEFFRGKSAAEIEEQIEEKFKSDPIAKNGAIKFLQDQVALLPEKFKVKAPSAAPTVAHTTTDTNPPSEENTSPATPRL